MDKPEPMKVGGRNLCLSGSLWVPFTWKQAGNKVKGTTLTPKPKLQVPSTKYKSCQKLAGVDW